MVAHSWECGLTEPVQQRWPVGQAAERQRWVHDVGQFA